MKKRHCIFICLLVSFYSCGISESLEFKVVKEVFRARTLTIPSTLNNAVPFEILEEVKLANQGFDEHIDKVMKYTVLSLTVKFKDYTGNNTEVINSGALYADNLVLGAVTNLNISQGANQETVFNIQDKTILHELETMLLNNQKTTIKFSGQAQTGAVSMSLNLELFIKIEATVAYD